MQCLTADRQLVFAVRSNATRNAPGKAVALAAGYLDVVGGKAETPLAAAARETLEETGLVIHEFAGAIVPQGAITNKAISTFAFSVKGIDGGERTAYGNTASIAEGFLIDTHLSAAALVSQLRPNHETLGYVVIPLADCRRLNEAEWGADIGVTAVFHPSEGAAQLLGTNDLNSLSELRDRMLRAPAKIAKGRYSLSAIPLRLRARRDDFENHRQQEYMQLNLTAAEQVPV